MARTIDAQASVRRGLTAKDFVFIAVFGLLLFAIFMAFSIAFGANANLVWFTHAVGSVPAGVVWMYLFRRVSKRGAVTVMGAIVAIVGFLMGMFWTGPVGIFVGALLAEVVMGAPGQRSSMRIAAAFAVFVLSFWMGHISLVLLSGQAYVEMCVAAGLDASYGQALVDFIYSPWALVAGGATIPGALAGSLLGAKLFEKHFARLSA